MTRPPAVSAPAPSPIRPPVRQHGAGVPLGVDGDPNRWRTLALLAIAELLGMSLWFAASAVGPQLGARWHLSQSQVGWLTAVVQLGFVLGTAVSALLNLADIIPSWRLFAASALLGALANASLLVASGFRAALTSRLLTGFALAGVYPPAMKMISTWFRARRGLAIGTIVGALTVGKAGPYLVHAFPGAGEVPVVLSATLAALLAAVLVLFGYRDGPYPFPPRPFSWALVATVVRERRWRLATAGYLGHMFELYSAWTWIPVFVTASLTASGMAAGTARTSLSSGIAFGAIAVGGIGCIWGGLVADRRGRERLVTLSLAASGCCALLIGFTFGGSLWILVAVALAWGFFVIADSAQFSVLVTESVPPHAVGTALTVQTSLGFLLTMVSIQLIPPAAALLGWRWAFTLLALGPIFGIAAIRRYARLASARVVS
ncbi:MAG TPA: MFS transporter [Gemmatimonadaceae bacterium]|nr:MFS transporter [Gemmatimonadaceae bacterium]